MRGLAEAISSTLTTPCAVSRIAWTRIGRSRPGLRLELGEQAIDVVDVPGALDLGHHHHLEHVADLGHQRRQVVEHPGALERVDPGPERGLAEVGLLRRLDQAGPRRLLAVDRDRVLEVAEQDVGLGWRCRAPWRPSSRSRSRGSGSSATAGPGSPAAAPGRRSPAGGGSLWGFSSGVLRCRLAGATSSEPRAVCRWRGPLDSGSDDLSDDRGSTDEWLSRPRTATAAPTAGCRGPPGRRIEPEALLERPRIG